MQYRRVTNELLWNFAVFIIAIVRLNLATKKERSAIYVTSYCYA